MPSEVFMKVRHLGHSCVEITGRHHVLIDPDFIRDPELGVEYICITHAHLDHIARVAEVPSGLVLASRDVCKIASALGVRQDRLRPVEPGRQIANVQVLPGYSRVNDPTYTFFYVLFRRRLPPPGGTPLSFLIKDEATLLHIGDAHAADLPVRPDILCLPWRRTPFGAERYREALVRMAQQFGAPYVLPVHHDMPPNDADAGELQGRVEATVLDGPGWHLFEGRRLAGRAD
jgi:L-ascorbate metabolism protein UlaG (beta-lactamase superfamily)